MKMGRCGEIRFTAETQRTPRSYFLLGGESPSTDVAGPPNKKSS